MLVNEPHRDNEDSDASAASDTDRRPIPVRTAVAAAELGYTPQRLARLARRHETIRAAVDWKLPGGHYRWDLDKLRAVLPPKHPTDTPDE